MCCLYGKNKERRQSQNCADHVREMYRNIWICSVHFLNMICTLICIICTYVKKLNKINCYELNGLFVYFSVEKKVNKVAVNEKKQK